MKQKLFVLFAAAALLLGMSACTNYDILGKNNEAPVLEV